MLLEALVALLVQLAAIAIWHFIRRWLDRK
jgi:hypothetical protein